MLLWTSPPAWMADRPARRSSASPRTWLMGRGAAADALGQGGAQQPLPDQPDDPLLVRVIEQVVDGLQVRRTQAVQIAHRLDQAGALLGGDAGQPPQFDRAIQREMLAGPAIRAEPLQQPIAAHLAFRCIHAHQG